MTIDELEGRWRSIKNVGSTPYLSLRLSAACNPELYIALDYKGKRHLILIIPKGVAVIKPNSTFQNLNFEWHEESRFLLFGVKSDLYNELFNHLTLSLYSRIKDLEDPATYTSEFLNTILKWADLFDSVAGSLSKGDVIGVFGELVFLNHLMEKKGEFDINQTIGGWQGPYGKAQDFVYPLENIEVKSTEVEEGDIKISSEFQLEQPNGKAIQLAIIILSNSSSGKTIGQLVSKLHNDILQRGGDVNIFYRTLYRTGINLSNIRDYDIYKWVVKEILVYNVNDDSGFPKITSKMLPKPIGNVSYCIVISSIKDFIISKIRNNGTR